MHTSCPPCSHETVQYLAADGLDCCPLLSQSVKTVSALKSSQQRKTISGNQTTCTDPPRGGGPSAAAQLAADARALTLLAAALIEMYPCLEDFLGGDAVREGLRVAKCSGMIQLLTLKGDPIFFRFSEAGPYLPHLKLVHRSPFPPPGAAHKRHTRPCPLPSHTPML